MMNYQTKYINKSRAIKRSRRTTPELWISGPDPIVHDMYYSWLKHKAQANYRSEEHNITWEEWQSLWTPDNWAQRGRGATNLCLSRIDTYGAWDMNNVQIVERREHLKRQGEFTRGK